MIFKGGGVRRGTPLSCLPESFCRIWGRKWTNTGVIFIGTCSSWNMLWMKPCMFPDPNRKMMHTAHSIREMVTGWSPSDLPLFCWLLIKITLSLLPGYMTNLHFTFYFFIENRFFPFDILQYTLIIVLPLPIPPTSSLPPLLNLHFSSLSKQTGIYI